MAEQPKQPPKQAPLEKYQSCLLRLRELNDAGQDESDEAERLGDRMDVLWGQLTEAQTKQLRVWLIERAREENDHH